jgi:hypothetical protein
VRLFSRQAALACVGILLAALTLCLALPVFFLAEVIGAGHAGLQIITNRIKVRKRFMKYRKKFSVTAIALFAWFAACVGLATAQQKPNILIIWGDDIGVQRLDNSEHEGRLETHLRFREVTSDQTEWRDK